MTVSEIQIELSSCERYRYRLWQVWQADTPTVAFIGLNPSTAEVHDHNPTFRRCVNFARSWGFGGIYMLNLFAYRAATPQVLKKVSHPIGPNNDCVLKAMSQQVDLVVAAWGNDGAHLNRSQAVRRLLPDLHVLKLNRSNEPAHPLYLKADLKPMVWPQTNSV